MKSRAVDERADRDDSNDRPETISLFWEICLLLFLGFVVPVLGVVLIVAMAHAQTPAQPAVAASPATQALVAALQNAAILTIKAQDAGIDALAGFKNVNPAIDNFLREQQAAIAQKDQWWAQYAAGMQQQLDEARKPAKKQ